MIVKEKCNITPVLKFENSGFERQSVVVLVVIVIGIVVRQFSHGARVIASDVSYTGIVEWGVSSFSTAVLRTVLCCMAFLFASIARRSRASRFIVPRLPTDEATSDPVSINGFSKGGLFDGEGWRLFLVDEGGTDRDDRRV